MNHFFRNVVVLFALFSSVGLFAQENILVQEKKKIFQPKFTLGSGVYTLTGDIQNSETGVLKGNSGFSAGMKFDLYKNIDLSFLVVKKSFSGNNGDEQFSSDLDGFGLHLGYALNQFLVKSKIYPIFSLGFQSLGFSTNIVGENIDRASYVAIPLGIGLRMDITDRLEFDVAMNFGIGLGDIDMSQINKDNSDGYKSLNFSIHYDLFSPAKNIDNDDFDDSYYADVDFEKLESEDEDGDLVPDMDDYCPKTPLGVAVGKNGCPLDDDKDGIPNYLDQQKNTVEGSIVDENGVRLTADKYKSMYSDFDVASRKYANFYNEEEIKRENYKTVDEYLIAKANAFNKAFNESLNDDSKVSSLQYKVKIGSFKDGIPAKTVNRLLSLDDLESFTMDDGTVIYSVGSYITLDDAMNRLYSMEEQGFDEIYIMVDNNGKIFDYVEPIADSEYDSEHDEVLLSFADSAYNDDAAGPVVTRLEDEMTNNETTYRIQIGAFSKPLSREVFVGVDNVISFTGKDGLVRYVTGSFVNYKDAISYRSQMKARGFEDAFIVTYKNGERISLNIAIKNVDANSVIEKKQDISAAFDLRFTVQIMVVSSSLSDLDLEKMSELGNIDKEQSGSLYKYYTGTYSNLEEAKVQLEKAKLSGFPDAFIVATNYGERISLDEAKELLE